MRLTYRYANNKDYWQKRWADVPVDSAMENTDSYPLKYANMIVDESKEGRILEAGCGPGRVLRYYDQKGYDIFGIDFIPDVIGKLKAKDPNLQVEVGDITQLNFADNYFKYILAFGLYHNFKMDQVGRAIEETYRVLQPGGKVCASFRADNIQNWFVDRITKNKQTQNGRAEEEKQFHKMNLKKNEFIQSFQDVGFKVETVIPVENMPFLYKFSFFRHSSQKNFNEKSGRKNGYKLSAGGRFLQSLCVRLFPDQFCNVYVLIAEKSSSV